MAITLADNAFERANLALSNILNPGTAGTALADPDSLSPEERRSMATKMLGTDHGIMSSVVDFVTNPLTLMGLVLTAKYPHQGAEKLLQFEQKTQQYAKAAAPFSKWWQDLHEMFHGTPLPQMFEQVTQINHLWQDTHARYGRRALEAYTKEAGPLTKERGTVIAAAMDDLYNPKHPVWEFLSKASGKRVRPSASAQATRLPRAEVELGEALRQDWTAQAIIVLKDSEGNPQALKQLRNMGVDPESILLKGNYFPHVETMTRGELQRRYEKWLNTIGSGTESRGKLLRFMREEQIEKQVTKRLLPRKNAMLPSEDHMKMAGLWTDEIAEAYALADQKRAAAQLADGKQPTPYRRYSLDLLEATSNYTRGMARTAAWSVPVIRNTEPVGTQIAREIKLIGEINPYKANILRDTILPLASGQLSWEQYLPAMHFSQAKVWAGDLLEKLPVPSSLKTQLTNMLAGTQSWSWKRVGSYVQQHFYLSTMGFNPISPLKNLLQSVITTIPAVGPKYFAQGLKDVTGRKLQMQRMIAGGMEKDLAFRKVFPEFYETTFNVGHKVTFHEFGPGERLDYDSKWRKFTEKLSDVSLKGFQWSEEFNRLVAFYSAHAKGMAELPGTHFTSAYTGRSGVLKKGPTNVGGEFTMWGEAIRTYADQITRQTQFGGGPLNTPIGALGLWGPIRQFTNFPLRVAGFALGPAMRDKKVLGRMLLGGSAAYYSGKALGADVSSALMFGALPELPDDERPFAPMPLISPFLQVVGSGMSAAAKGDLEEFSKALPLIVPFGVQANRMITWAAPEVAKKVGRPYADYDGVLADGRIPVYSRQNSLVGYYTYWQLVAKSMGLGNINASQEQALMKYFLKQRDIIRDYKNQYRQAMLAGDPGAMTKINAEYKQHYPNTGEGIMLKKSEIEAIQLRREIPRIEKLLDTLPPEQRQAFAGVVAAAMGSGAEQFLGVDPSIMQDGGTSRGRPRPKQMRPTPSTLPSATQTPMTSGDVMQIIEQYGRDVSQTQQDQGGFSPFSSY